MERRIIFFLLLLIVNCGGGKPSTADTKSKGGKVIASDFEPSHPTSTTPIIITITAITQKNPEYIWTVNDIEQNVNKSKLTPDRFSKGDTVFCSILIAGIEKKRIGPIIIGNSEPRILSLKIIPEEPKAGKNLRVETRTIDTDGDDIEQHIKWYINDEKVSEGEVLTGDMFRAGDVVYAEIIPYDGEDEGIKGVTSPVTVLNTPPDILSKVPSISGRIMDYPVKTSDMDGDSVSLILDDGPSGMRFEGNRLIWEAPEVEKDTVFYIKIIARDERGGETSSSFNLLISKTEVTE